MSDKKPNWKPIEIRLGDLIPWGDNPKYSTKEDARRLLETEAEFGQFQTFAVSPFLEGGKVNCYDGHQRDSAWRTAKGDDFKVWAMQSDRHLTEAERRKFVLRAHNAHGQWSWDSLSGWDAETLKAGWFNSDTLHGWNMDALNLREMLNSDAEPVDPNEEWEGMPEHISEEIRGNAITCVVRFLTEDDRKSFEEFLGWKLSHKGKMYSTWYPKSTLDQLGKGLEFTDEP